MIQQPKFFHLSFYYLALASGFSAAFFILNNFLIYIFGWQGAYAALAELGILSGGQGSGASITGLLQIAGFLLALGAPLWLTHKARMTDFNAALSAYETRFSVSASFIVAFAFWGVMLVGITDAIISFLRIEDMLVPLVGEKLTSDLGRSVWRGTYIHLPLLIVAGLIASKRRGISFIWLALLIVAAELLIVVARFIFSYEQAFMGDLVRFWYAALFLFASAQTLVEEGHVRVDVIYANFTEQRKSLVNVMGSAFLGAPLCWVIISRGMWDKTSVINSPLLNFETSQSGFGMYVKYLMAGFLIIFALSMILQFSSFIMKHLHALLNETPSEAASEPANQSSAA